MKGQWEFFVQYRDYARKLGWTMFAVALVTSITAFWKPIEVPVAGLFGIFAMWCVSMGQVMQQLADKQAALDMREHHRRGRVGTEMHVAGGNIIAFEDGAKVLFRRTTTIEVLP